MIDATTTSGLVTSTTASSTAASELEETYNSFLTLLTAQISNQDPLEPVDSTQFVSQLAQLTQVEQSVTTNANLESIGSMLSAVAAMSDLQLIGRDVLVPSDQIRLTETDFPLSYQVGAGASEVKIKIYSGEDLIREIDGPSTAEGDLIDVTWDGLDADGIPVPPGTFRVELTAADDNGDAVAVAGLTTAKVERVDFTAQGPQLLLGNGETVLSQVVQSVL